MDRQNFYLLKAAQFRIRAQTERYGTTLGYGGTRPRLHRLAEGRGTETALTADFETPMTSPLQGKQ